MDGVVKVAPFQPLEHNQRQVLVTERLLQLLGRALKRTHVQDNVRMPQQPVAPPGRVPLCSGETAVSRGKLNTCFGRILHNSRNTHYITFKHFWFSFLIGL